MDEDNCSAVEPKKIIRLNAESGTLENTYQAQEQNINKSLVITVSETAKVDREVYSSDSGEKKEVSEPSSSEKLGILVTLRPPRRKLLVLDLNGLLADIVSPPPKEFVADINIARRAVFVRPSYFDFLKFCFERFEVGVWSSRSKKNIDRITAFLFRYMKDKLAFCWDMSYCTVSHLGTIENKHKYVVFKELRTLWEKEDSSLPWEKGDYNESNTLLLDDSPYKALLNPPHTAIFPHSYKFHDHNDKLLGDGGELRVYLKKLDEAENVQEFVKNNPFGQEPISETSECWSFYSEVISNLHRKETTIELQ